MLGSHSSGSVLAGGRYTSDWLSKLHRITAMTKERITTNSTATNRSKQTVVHNTDKRWPCAVYFLYVWNDFKFWTWHDNALLKRSCNTHVAFLQKHSTLNPQGWKLRLKTSYLLCPPLLQVTPTSGWHSSWHIFEHVSDILTQTFSLKLLSDIANIFWHSWHIFDHSFWHILSDLLANISSDILSDLSCDILQLLLLTHSFCNYYQSFSHHSWGPRHATLNSHDRSWGPARHTALAGIAVGVPAHNTEHTRSQLGSGTPHWTSQDRGLGVRRATLHSQDRGWGPARHTELTGSQLRSDEEEDDRRRRRRRRREKRLT